MDDYIGRHEFNEAFRRLEEENDRQNHRIQVLEKQQEKNTEIILTIQNLAHSIDTMSKELNSQGQRLEEIEKRPIDTIRQIKKDIISVCVGILAGGMVTAIVQIIIHFVDAGGV